VLCVARVDTLAGLDALELEWSELLARHPGANLFLSHAWMASWWRHFSRGRDLWILTVREGEQLLAIAPMQLGWRRYGGLPLRVLELVSNWHMSRGDLIVAEREADVFAALTGFWLRHRTEWDVVILDRVPLAAPTLPGLFAAMRAADAAPRSFFGGSLEEALTLRAVKRLGHTPVAGSFDEFLRRRSANFRRSLKRMSRGLAAVGRVGFTRHATPDEVDASMAQVFALERASWKGKGRSRDSALDDNQRFQADIARRLAPHGGFENRLLTLDGVPIAALHCLSWADVLYMIVTYYDPLYAEHSPGHALIATAFAEHWDTGRFRDIDFNGESEMIQRWSESAHVLGRLCLCSPTQRGRAVALLRSLRHRWRPPLEIEPIA